MTRSISRDPSQWALMVLTDAGLAHGRSHVEVARLALAGGADAIQFREKAADCRELHAIAVEIRRLTREAGAAFIVNDRIDLALASEADGLHIGQEDLFAPLARKIIGTGLVLGVSARTPEEALQAEHDGADYIGFGPVFEARASKPDAGVPRGCEALAAARTLCSIPILGIGGIGEANAASVIQAGASGVAVITAVAGAADVAEAARRLRSRVIDARAKGRTRAGG
jgi:thiamine-phosphate pyrophosphorylase